MMKKMELKSVELMEEVETKKGIDYENEDEEEEEDTTTFHVLAVDDSLIDRMLLEKLLTLSSYQVTCVESGDKALEYLGLVHTDNNNIINSDIITDSTSSSSPSASSCTSPSSSKQELQGSKVNLIMTDYSMPGMSGYDLLKIVKGSSWKDVPVVVMSSENVPSRINMCLEGGAEEFLLKPLKLSDLKKLQSQLLVSSSSHSHEGANDGEEKIKNPTNLVDEIINNSSSSSNNNNNTNNESSINLSTNKRKKAMSRDLSELYCGLIIIALIFVSFLFECVFSFSF